MHKTREILRQKWLLGRTHRQTATSTGTSPGAVGSVLARAKAAGLTTWEQVTQLDDEALERALYGTAVVEPGVKPAEPDCAWIHRERHRPHVTLELLHLEYLRQHPNGLRYTAFCNRYRAWLARRGLVMRQVHVAGEKMFVDYAGKKPTLVDPATGAVTEVELFVAVLGASSYTYAEATRSQRGPDWIGSHCRAFAFFGGVPRAVVCDQLKSGVTRACRYEPQVQRTYEEMAAHYGTTVLPARPKHPRDKAKVEVAVQVVERWILARIRNEVFHSLAALNARIAELLIDINSRVMKRYGESRRELFEKLERPALAALPAEAFEYAEWKKARVNIDYHVVFDGHFHDDGAPVAPQPIDHENIRGRDYYLN